MTTINPTDVGGEGVKDDTLTDVKVGGGETETENNEEKEDVIYAEIHKKWEENSTNWIFLKLKMIFF